MYGHNNIVKFALNVDLNLSVQDYTVLSVTHIGKTKQFSKLCDRIEPFAHGIVENKLTMENR